MRIYPTTETVVENSADIMQSKTLIKDEIVLFILGQVEIQSLLVKQKPTIANGDKNSKADSVTVEDQRMTKDSASSKVDNIGVSSQKTMK